MVVNKIMIKNTTTGQSDSADIGASAENISFDPTGSNLESTDTESAIKETYGAIPANTSQLINDSNFVVSSSLANVATSGDYEDLSNTPSLATVATSGSYSDLSNTPVLAAVATSGSYNDLSNTPTIPSIEANPSDTATNTLTKLEVDGTIYNVASGSGGSTVAWNQIQTSTGATKIAEISIDGDSTDVYAPSGGSGSGGHTILDNDGTALTQRDEMQFVGTYSEDDSTNEITKVNIVREMTKAEFDLLSDDEKTGIINVTDEAGIASVINGVFIDTDNVIISLTEYKPSMTYTATKDCYIVLYTVFGSNTTIHIDSEIVGNFDGSGNFGITNNFYLKKGQTISVTNASSSYNSYYIVYGIQQGSQETTKNEIYSTDERAVGTWIDGSTVYQKTVHYVNTRSSFSDYETIETISNINIPIKIDFIAKRVSGSSFIYMTGNGSTHPEQSINYSIMARIYMQDLQYMITQYGTEISDMWFTIKYTKSTT